MVVVLLAILVLRRRGARGASRERQLLCVFLAAMPLVYVESGLWNSAGSWLLVEGAGFILFSVWAWLSYRRDAAWLALGIAAHGLLWDSWHTESSYIPAWYGHACLVVDLGLALYVLLQRDRLAVASIHVRAPEGALRQSPAAQEPLPVLDAQAAAIRADMLRDLATTLRTLERAYDGLRHVAYTDTAQRRERYTAATPDIRTVLTRLRLLLPSLRAGRMVMPDMAGQRQQTSSLGAQSSRELAELGVAAAAARHTELFQQAIEAVLLAASQALGASGDKTPTVQSLDTLAEQIERAQHATQLLLLTLAQE